MYVIRYSYWVSRKTGLLQDLYPAWIIYCSFGRNYLTQHKTARVNKPLFTDSGRNLGLKISRKYLWPSFLQIICFIWLRNAEEQWRILCLEIWNCGGWQLKDCGFPVEALLRDGWHSSAGWCVLVRHWDMSHFSEDQQHPKGEKNTQHPEGPKSKANLQLWWQKCQSFQRRQQNGDWQSCTELPWTPVALSCLFTLRYSTFSSYSR